MSERDDLSEQAYQTPALRVRPHSRACKISTHEHGLECHSNCPSCEGTNLILHSNDKPAKPSHKPGAEQTMNIIKDMMSGMNYLLAMQRTVESAWGRQVDPTDPEAVSKYVREVILCATDELHEVLAEVHWKPWKEARGIKDVARYRSEMADVMHFVLDLYLAAGLTGEDIVMDYMTKHYTNMERTTDPQYRAE